MMLGSKFKLGSRIDLGQNFILEETFIFLLRNINQTIMKTDVNAFEGVEQEQEKLQKENKEITIVNKNLNTKIDNAVNVLTK